MLEEMYYEENNVIPIREYKQMLDMLQKNNNFRPSQELVIRKIYFNKNINYLSDAMSVDQENSECYSISMTNWNHEQLLLEGKSKRGGMICKRYAPISEQEFESLIDGDYEWMLQKENNLFLTFYWQLTINQVRPGVVVDCRREIYRVNQQKDCMVFDKSVRSTYLFTKDTLLSPLLELHERLDSRKVIIAYKQSVKMPEYVCRLPQFMQSQKIMCE